MGWFIVQAEPAVHVLTKQVEEISAGTVSEKAMHLSLSVAIACAMGLAMVRTLTGMHIFWLLIAVRAEEKNTIMRAIMEQAGPQTPAGAISFSLPISSAAGLRYMDKD